VKNGRIPACFMVSMPRVPRWKAEYSLVNAPWTWSRHEIIPETSPGHPPDTPPKRNRTPGTSNPPSHQNGHKQGDVNAYLRSWG